jgi:hypothetical protein
LVLRIKDINIKTPAITTLKLKDSFKNMTPAETPIIGTR